MNHPKNAFATATSTVVPATVRALALTIATLTFALDAPSAAWAQLTPPGFDDHAGCWEGINCPGNGQHGGQAPTTYVAIAASDTTLALGFAKRGHNATETREAALGYCHAKDCKVAAIGWNRCAAAATSQSIHNWFVSTEPSLTGAKQDVLGDCRKAGARDCTLKVATCSWW